jgi:hypothetical protein
MRWPNRAEVCLEAGKTASRRKTKTENRSETGANGETIRPRNKISQKLGLFPQPVKPALIIGHFRPG